MAIRWINSTHKSKKEYFHYVYKALLKSSLAAHNSDNFSKLLIPLKGLLH